MRNKNVAALWAFFLGGFGAHKFYLGQTTAGILYLVFFWSYIPSILSLFDFIALLSISEELFEAEFNHVMLPRATTTLTVESSLDKIKSLKELKNLYDLGIITAEEFEQKRRKILDTL